MKPNLTQVWMAETPQADLHGWMGKVQAALLNMDVERPATWMPLETLAREYKSMVRLVELLRVHCPVPDCRVPTEAGCLVLAACHPDNRSLGYVLDVAEAYIREKDREGILFLCRMQAIINANGDYTHLNFLYNRLTGYLLACRRKRLEEYRKGIVPLWSETKEGKAFGFTSTAAEPMFGYKGKWGVKVYRPKSDIRFVYGGHTGDRYCFGLEQLPSKGDLLFITGGEKDVLTLAAHGFHAICFNSETSLIPAKTVQKLVYRFKHIVLLYDTDKTGLESSEKQARQLSEYGVKRLVLPLPGTKTEKDVTDYFRAGHTREEFMGLFLKLLDALYGDTMAVLKSCEIDYDHPPQQAVSIITAGDVPLGTEENILCITGGEGTGKSNYTAALVAGAIQERETEADLLGVRVEPNRRGRAVLLYDTEQSEQQLYKNVGRLLRRAGQERMPHYLHAYCLTGMSRNERLTAIVQSMDKYHYLHGGIHLVVIDGVADLIRCANDEAESVALIDEIYRLAGIYRTCIAAVVHFVPNGLKLRGHLGSELQRKSAAILSIEKDENPEISVVKALKVRDGSPLDIPLMQFRWDKQAGMPVYVGEKPRAEKEKRKEKELAEMAREAFARQEKYSYIDLCELIQEMLEVKERTAKGYIRYMREKEIIEKEGDCYVHGQRRV